MFDFFKPNLNRITSQFQKTLNKLEKALDFHQKKADLAAIEKSFHTAEADRATRLANKFREFV